MTIRAAIGYLFIAALAVYALYVIPLQGDMTTMINGTIYASYAILALSLGLVWGYAGILSFGQASFFGIGGYVYAITALNLEQTWPAVFIAVAAAAAFAALLGYFMFWGRLSDVYLGVITLTVSLMLYRFFNQTAGDEWTIGVAPLGGFNGIPSTPVLTSLTDTTTPLLPEDIYVIAVWALVGCYLICKLVLRSRFGQVAVAMRENEMRAELLGYDPRLYKLGVFTLSGALAGMAGVLFANSVIVSPNMFNLQTNGQVIIWTIIGGLGTLSGPVIGCFLMLSLSNKLGTLGQDGIYAWADPNLVMGVLLTVFVIALPRGIVPMLTEGAAKLEDFKWFRNSTSKRSLALKERSNV
jgi:branched-chain amino acid transport system permease protein